MQSYQRVVDLRESLAPTRASGKRIAFVPTMGNLHEGHMQLIRLAHQHADVVVASIFVNPLQFGLNEDWEMYPRMLASDTTQLMQEKCDYLFCPTEQEIYPNGMETQTKVIVPTMTDILCGASRPGHFTGVTTIVAKLFNMVLPHVAILGIKDYQQLTVIRRMVEDLCFPIDIVAAPTARAPDGLALSSRNAYLNKTEREQSTALHKTLLWVQCQLKDGRRDYVQLETQGQQKLLDAGMRPDYLSVRQAQTLELATAADTEIVVLAAVYLGRTRLIDNLTIQLNHMV